MILEEPTYVVCSSLVVNPIAVIKKPLENLHLKAQQSVIGYMSYVLYIYLMISYTTTENIYKGTNHVWFFQQTMDI